MNPHGPDPYLGLLDLATHRDAVRSRSTARAHHAVAAQLATWTGSLHDLAESRRSATVRTISGGVRRGTLTAVGLDHLVLSSPDGALVLIALGEITLVRPDPSTYPPTVATGDRGRSQDRTLLEALEVLMETRDVVIAVRGSAEPLRGRVTGIGEDVVTLRLAGSDHAVVYLPAGAIAEVLLTG